VVASPVDLVSYTDSGVVEGLDNMRKSCGFRTFRLLEMALYHQALGPPPRG